MLCRSTSPMFMPWDSFSFMLCLLTSSGHAQCSITLQNTIFTLASSAPCSGRKMPHLFWHYLSHAQAHYKIPHLFWHYLSYAPENCKMSIYFCIIRGLIANHQHTNSIKYSGWILSELRVSLPNFGDITAEFATFIIGIQRICTQNRNTMHCPTPQLVLELDWGN